MRTFPEIGIRADGNKFSKDLEEIYKSFKISNLTANIKNKKIYKISGGDPLCYKSFKMCEKYLKDSLKKDAYKYPPAAGDEYYREIIAKYLLKEGFNSGKNITIDNVIVTMSTTHGFKTILDVIARPYDVILMPSPCYGLFAFFPERINVNIRFLKLKKEDNYYINTDELDKEIKSINEELKIKYNNLDYVPKVVAFFNQNPHNPTGVVMSKNNIDLINNISKVCKNNNAFLIDDLVYRDLTFNSKEIALPMAYNSEYFNNTISLMGLSKCYGYASARAGIVIANENIITEMRNKIFQQMDSIPTLQCAMLAGAFNTTYKRKVEYEKYFSKLNKEYEYRYLLLKTLIDGYDSIVEYIPVNITRNKLKRQLKRDIKNNSRYKENILCGIKGVKFLDGIDVKGRFFCID